jgi:hypothetical protein
MKLIDAESTLVVNNIFDIRKTGIDENNGTQQIYNNIFIKNSIALNLPSSTEHQYNLFWDNRLNFGNGQQDSTEVLINPQFINQESGNYKLASSSPALNSGHPEIRWNDNNGTRNDIGLYGGPYADTTMFALLNSRLCIGNVPGNPGDTVVVPIYAIDAAGISGVQILVSYDAGRLSLLEAHTTTLTQDFVLLRKHIGSSIIELMLQGYRSIFLDSGSIIEITFVVSKNASGNIPLKFQNVQLIGASTQTVQGISFENGEIVLSSNSVRLVNSNIPKEFALYQNYPNPFNPSTIIKYSLPRTANVQVKIFDILGRELVILWNKEQQAGTYQITYNASTLSSGIYFYQLRAGDFLQTKKMLLLK